MALTYLDFHLAFVVPPLAALTAAASRKRVQADDVGSPAVLVAVTLLALVYTVPWDNYLIAVGVWSYGAGAVEGVVWNAPIEEYLFVLLQPFVAGLWYYQAAGLVDPRSPDTEVTTRDRLLGAAAGGAVGVAGAAMLTTDATFYLGAILVWAAPVLALQWAVGWPQLVARRRLVALGVAVPTLYFWVADWVAIRLGIWILSPTYTTGLTLLGLPIEEATFFLVTNLFVVQGLVLYPWVVRRWQ